MDVVAHLDGLQDDPTRVVAPNAELVLWTRLGADFDTAELDEAVETGQLVNLRGHLLPSSSIADYRAEMAAWPYTGPHKPWQDRELKLD